VPLAPGAIRDSIINYLSTLNADAALPDIMEAVAAKMGKVSPSSVRSYLNLNVPDLFERTERGRYRLREAGAPKALSRIGPPAVREGAAALYHADCFDWLAGRQPQSIHAVVTDPPYGLVEYSQREQAKLRVGRGGVWRIPPSFDGHNRSPLPRFTVLDARDREALQVFFAGWARFCGM
jgi:hypothetical protein